MQADYDKQLFGITEVIQKTGISCERLRYWEKIGIVKPNYVQCGSRKVRRYCEEDIHRSILIKTLIDDGNYTLEDAIKKLVEEEGNI